MFLLLLACVHRPFAVPPPVEFSACVPERSRIAEATYSEAALTAVRGYLGCVARVGSPPADLPEIVRYEVARNPYEAAQRVDVYAWFFDLEGIKPVPSSMAAMSSAIVHLRDQALAREAMGEADIAAAARARAEKLQGLQSALLMVEE